VLALTACAVLAGATSLLAVGEWIADAPTHVPTDPMPVPIRSLQQDWPRLAANSVLVSRLGRRATTAPCPIDGQATPSI
jgi:hypothetical protein